MLIPWRGCITSAQASLVTARRATCRMHKSLGGCLSIGCMQVLGEATQPQDKPMV